MSSALPLAGIDVAILVGGLGTRLRGVIGEMPKPLAEVAGRPFLHYILDKLAANGVRSVTLCSGYLADKLRASIGENWRGVPVKHSVEEQPLGTAGALALARRFVSGDHVLVMNGDTWFEVDFERFRRSAATAALTIAAAMVPDASRYGALKVDSSGWLIGFDEKTESTAAGLINGGMYFFSPSVLNSLIPRPSSIERDLLPALAGRKRVKVVVFDTPFVDIGVPEDYARAASVVGAEYQVTGSVA
jgi:D-glycero-alpha-D-manno-heptose 1-phosphate guanylyltransferase